MTVPLAPRTIAPLPPAGWARRPGQAGMRGGGRGVGAATLVLLAACATPPGSVTDFARLPAESALMQGLVDYDEARYAQAERSFTQALQLRLTSGRDTATAYKHLAFIYCSTRRLEACEAAFRAARAADPQFALTRAELGHPMWSPVYRKLLVSPAPKAAERRAPDLP